MSFSWTQYTPIAGLALVLYLTLTRLSSLLTRSKTIPGPKGYPLLGNLPSLASTNGNLVPLFARWAKQHGPIAQFSLFGETQIILSDESMVHDLFVQRGNIYSDRSVPHAVKYAMRDISPAIMPKNASWRRQRRLLHAAISTSVNESYEAGMREEAVLAVRELLASPGAFDCHFQRYSYGVIGRCFFGLRVAAADDAFVVENEAYINTTMRGFDPVAFPVNVFPWLAYLPRWLVPSLKEMEELRALNDERVGNLARDVKRQNKGGVKLAQGGIFNEFLKNRADYDVSDEEANSAFFALIGGGTRSMHNALLTFVYLMMAYPDWQTKLQAHIDDVVSPDRLPTWADMPNLPMVRAVVKEGIRYRTIVAELGIPHRLSQDDEYMGWKFEKGTTFHANYGTILLDPATYPDAHPFNPARWLDPSYPTYRAPLTIHPNCQNYAPFGYGRRACPGYDFAEKSLVMMVAVLAWSCTVKRPLNEKGEEFLPEIKYEVGPNPKPHSFGCRIVAREGRAGVLERERERM